MATSWRVDSIHLGLGVVGDSAIHLLVEQPNAGGAGLVRYALLVDGGDNGGQARVLAAIANIEALVTKYDLSPLSSPLAKKLKFSAIVISHWDTDHWTGVLFAMRQDIEAQKANPNDPITDFKVSFLQYDETVNPRTPRTILYAPAYGIPTTGCHLAPRPANANIANANLVLRKDPAPISIVRNAVRIRYEPAGAPAGTASTLMGTNLITGNDLPIPPGSSTVEAYEDITSPTLLVTANPPAQTVQPGIYIVGISKRTIGPPPGYEVVDDGSGKPKNESSVACMIIWPGTGVGPGSAPRLSHYSAGDLHWMEEGQIVRWTGADGVRTTKGGWVTTVKASHHGAKSSTPVNMLDRFNPQNVIASAGEKNGHPSKQQEKQPFPQ